MITMHDAFCGAGGSLSGAIENLGVRVTYALNHEWVRMAGNAVTPPAARDLVAVVDALT